MTWRSCNVAGCDSTCAICRGAELEPEDVVRRSAEAKAVFNAPVFIETMRRLDATYIENWRQSSDPISREKYWAKMNALKEVQDALEGMINDAVPVTTESTRISRTLSSY